MLFFNPLVPFRDKHYFNTISGNKELLTWTVPVNMELLTGLVLINKLFQTKCTHVADGPKAC